MGTVATQHRVGVVGAGLVGVRHAEAFSALRGVSVAAVFDVVPATAVRFAERFGAQAVATLADLLADETVDIVVVATSDQAHFDTAMAVIDAGRHMLLEKPLAADLAEATRIAERASASERVVGVGHQLRFDARYVGAAREVRSGALGRVSHCHFRRNSSIAGPIRYGRQAALASHVLVHDVDLLRFITGHEIVSVVAAGTKLSATAADLDSLLVLARLDDGAIATFEASWILPTGVGSMLDAQTNVVCLEGSVSVTTAEQGLAVIGRDGITYPDTVRFVEVDGHSAGLMHQQAAAFVGAVDGTPSNALCRPDDALAAVRVADAVTRSLATGSWVLIDGAASSTGPG